MALPCKFKRIYAFEGSLAEVEGIGKVFQLFQNLLSMSSKICNVEFTLEV
jgi:hypothetical protein